jgi:two-component system sensor kinase FixL
MDIAAAPAGVLSDLEDRDLWIGLTIFALASLIGNEISSTLRYPDVGSAVFFPPYAVLAAALIASPRRQWIWFVIVGSLTHFATHWPQWSWSWVVLADVANVARALVAAVLLQRLSSRRFSLDSLRGLSIFFFVAVVVAPAVAASIGAANVVLHGASATYWAPWRAWFVSNALTALTMLPACLCVVAAITPGLKWPRIRGRVAEMLLLLAALAATCTFAFLGGLGRQHVALPLYGSLPVLIWASVRFGVCGASLSLTTIAFAAIWSVDRGTGPFLAPSPDDNILALQLFIACTSAPVLCLATLASGRESALRLYRALLASLEDQVAIVDAHGVIIAVNESWRRAAGTTADSIGAEIAAGLASVLAGTRQRFEIECDRTTGGLTEVFAVSVEKLERPEGGAVVIRRNVTARRHADRELQEQRAQLSHLSRVTTVSHLSGALAHELVQPLTAIRTNVEVVRRLVRRGTTDADELGEILDDVVADGRRASDIIDGIRGFLKKRDASFEAIDVSVLIDEVLTLAKTEQLTRSVAITTEIGDRLPQIHGDRVQLQQVLVNLILNGSEAVASTPESEKRRGSVVVAATDSGDGTVHLRVRDSGPGISPMVLPRLFTPFMTTKVNGLGLGLSICHSIVSDHRGRLWAENNVGGGATFHCLLPIHHESPAADELATPPQPITVSVMPIMGPRT